MILWILLARALMPDWDEVMMLAMGFAGLAYIVADLKRERRLDAAESELRERITRLEAAPSLDSESLLERVTRCEDATTTHAERLATIEARIDHKPITHTRAKDGKFASPEVTK